MWKYIVRNKRTGMELKNFDDGRRAAPVRYGTRFYSEGEAIVARLAAGCDNESWVIWEVYEAA